MSLKIWFKTRPPWLKGGLIGLAIYIGCLLVPVTMFFIGGPIGERNPNLFSAGSLWVTIPFDLVALYPGLIVGGFLMSIFPGIRLMFYDVYRAMLIVIPLNMIMYFTGGALVGMIIGKVKRSNI